MADLYAPLAAIGPQSFPGRPGLFDALDANGNQGLEEHELAGLYTHPAHLSVKISFEAPSEPGNRGVSLAVAGEEGGSVRIVRTSDDRIAFDCDETLVVFSVHDSVGAAAYGEIAEGQFNAYDVDDSNYLDEEELPPGLGAERFPALDRDGDGMVTLEEYQTFVRLQQTVRRSQLRLIVHDQGDALLAALDTDFDGRLGHREVTEAAARLTELDTNGDGALGVKELPWRWTAMLLLGETRQFSQLVDLPPVSISSKAGSDAPEWFRRGDFNGDGDISRREFLGTPDQFAHLDTDANGFVDATEAAGDAP